MPKSKTYQLLGGPLGGHVHCYKNGEAPPFIRQSSHVFDVTQGIIVKQDHTYQLQGNKYQYKGLVKRPTKRAGRGRTERA